MNCSGPEPGMDYMHGVLMHGDGDAGDDHKNEDTYLRLQVIDTEKAKQAQDGVGPCKGRLRFVQLLYCYTYTISLA